MSRRAIAYFPGAALALSLALLASLNATAQSQPAAPNRVAPDTTSLDRVFSAAQAEVGAGIFLDVCTRCHTLPDFAGGQHSPTAKFQNLGEMFTTISNRMPMDDPGSLTPEQYAAVVSYILQENGYPMGAVDLPADVNKLTPIRIVPVPKR